MIQHKVRISIEAVNDEWIWKCLNELNLPYKAITFVEDGWENRLPTVVFQDKPITHLLLSAPKDDLQEAAIWVIEHNKDLNLILTGEPAYNADDFVYNRMSTILTSIANL